MVARDIKIRVEVWWIGCDVLPEGEHIPEMPAGKLMPNPIPNAP